MADFELGGFSLGGGDTPDIGSSIPGAGLNFGGNSGSLGVPDWLSSFNSGAGSGGGDSSWLGSFTSGLDKVMSPISSVAKSISPILGLGASGLGIANSVNAMKQAGQNQQMQKQAMGTERDISRAALPAATNLVNAGSTAMLGGPLPSGIQAQVDDFKRKSMAEINQYLSHAGIADSTMMEQWKMYVDQQATLYGQQLSQGLYGQGLQGLGVAGQGANALASTSSNLNANVPSSIQEANKALGVLAAQT
jgi:hypothetical protein